MDACSNLKSFSLTDDAMTHHMKKAHLQAILRKAADQQQPQALNLKFSRYLQEGVPHSITVSK